MSLLWGTRWEKCYRLQISKMIKKCQGTGDDTMNSRKITCASFLFGGEHINKGK